MPESKHTPPVDWREVRRVRAWELHQKGWSQSQIANELGVNQGAVSRWFKRVGEVGAVDGLRRHPAPGKRKGSLKTDR